MRRFIFVWGELGRWGQTVVGRTSRLMTCLLLARFASASLRSIYGFHFVSCGFDNQLGMCFICFPTSILVLFRHLTGSLINRLIQPPSIHDSHPPQRSYIIIISTPKTHHLTHFFCPPTSRRTMQYDLPQTRPSPQNPPLAGSHQIQITRSFWKRTGTELYVFTFREVD